MFLRDFYTNLNECWTKEVDYNLSTPKAHTTATTFSLGVKYDVLLLKLCGVASPPRGR